MTYIYRFPGHSWTCLPLQPLPIFAGVSAQGLRRQTKRPYEGLAHPARISKTRFLRDNLNGMTALLNHEPCRLKAQFLDGFGRGLSGFLLERAAELTRTEVGNFRQLSNGQFAAKVLFGVTDGILNAV